jgi:hypothetical protein
VGGWVCVAFWVWVDVGFDVTVGLMVRTGFGVGFDFAMDLMVHFSYVVSFRLIVSLSTTVGSNCILRLLMVGLSTNNVIDGFGRWSSTSSLRIMTISGGGGGGGGGVTRLSIWVQ